MARKKLKPGELSVPMLIKLVIPNCYPPFYIKLIFTFSYKLKEVSP